MFQEIQDWQLKRLGKFTASEIHKLLQAGKTKAEYFGKTALSYIDEKIAELITGQPTKDLSGLAALEWGNAHEYEGLMLLQERIGKELTIYGGSNSQFFLYNEYSGGSPDAETESEIVEAKCPYNPAIHAANLIASLSKEPAKWLKENRKEYYIQTQFNMMTRKKEVGLFWSYDPRPIEVRHKGAIIRLPADIELHQQITERIERAAEIVSGALELLTQPFSVILAEYDENVKATIIT